MKKIYTTNEYIVWHKRHLSKLERKLHNKHKPHISIKSKHSKSNKNKFIAKDTIYAPIDFRLFENTYECLLFYRNIRSQDYLNHINGQRVVFMSLKFITKIDYGAISILTAISDDLKYKKIVLQGDFPDNPDCRKFIIDSDFLAHMVNNHNKKFVKSDKSDLIFFEKGCGVLSTDDNRKISNLLKNVVKHLTGIEKNCLPLKSILLEICGNSIEHAYRSSESHWLLGASYENEKVIFTVTDVGKGILETLYRKFGEKIKDRMLIKSDDEVLYGAFEKKYSSRTLEINRNKGLPAVKLNSDEGKISELKVMTNNVILFFNDRGNSQTFKKGNPRFRGTFYQWEIDIECLNKINEYQDENN